MYWVNRSKLPEKAIITNAAKIRMLRGLRILEAFAAKSGSF